MRTKLMATQLFIGMLFLCVATAGVTRADELTEGKTLTVQGNRGTVKTLDSLPYVDSTYTRRMIWQRHDDPRLRKLREQLRLDNVIMPGKDEFERQLHLMQYVNRLWRFGDPRVHRTEASPAKIIEYQMKEERFYCEHFACVMSGCASSLGWVYRLLSHGGHTWGEMWSNQYGKWVYLDPTGNVWATDREGTPLSTAEFRQDHFYNEDKNNVFHWGVGGDKVRGRYNRCDVFGFHPNTNLMDEHFDYEKMFIIQDKFSRRPNVRGHGDRVKNPLVDPYFPINQAALTLSEAKDGIAVSIRTLTPNFKTFRCRVDGGKWLNCKPDFIWKLHGGENVFEAKSVNMFEVDGTVSRVVVELAGNMPRRPDDYLGRPAPEEENKSAGMPALTPHKSGVPELAPVAFEEKLEDQWLSMWFTKGHWIEWTADVPAAGQYVATVYYSSSYYPRRSLQLNGKTVPGMEAFILPYTGGWGRWQKADLPVKLSLKAGRNTLRFTCRDEISVWIRQIRLRGPGGAEVTLSGVDYTAEGGGTAQKTLVPKNGFLMWSAKGGWLEWEVDAEAGEYRVFLVTGALVKAARDMKVNGQLIRNPSRFVIEPTGGWRVFTEMPFGVASLKNGKNVIRMENLTVDCPNLASIKLVGSKGKTLVVNAVDFTAEGGGKVTRVGVRR